MEAPIMLVVIIVAARWIVRYFAPLAAAERLGIGMAALGLLLCSEFTLVLGLRGLTIMENLASCDPVSGAVYVALLGGLCHHAPRAGPQVTSSGRTGPFLQEPPCSLPSPPLRSRPCGLRDPGRRHRRPNGRSRGSRSTSGCRRSGLPGRMAIAGSSRGPSNPCSETPMAMAFRHG